MEIDYARATILAIIQGLTEFLPISSSAHLIFPSALFGWEDQGLAFDVAVHLGTLSAVLAYFRRDIQFIIRGLWLHATQGRGTHESHLGVMLMIASVPVLAAGFLLKDVVESQLRSTAVIATTTIVFGLLLYWADRQGGARPQGVTRLSFTAALVIGLAQVFALIPGTSRSGVTMTAAMFCGLDRHQASRFSFLLSIPVIAGAGFLLIMDLVRTGQVNWPVLVYATVLSGGVAYTCIVFFLRTINRIGFLPFVLYRLVLGILLFALFV